MRKQHFQPFEFQAWDSLIGQAESPYNGGRYILANSMQKDDHAGEIFRVVENLPRVLIGSGNPRVSEDRVFELLV